MINDAQVILTCSISLWIAIGLALNTLGVSFKKSWLLNNQMSEYDYQKELYLNTPSDLLSDIYLN